MSSNKKNSLINSAFLSLLMRWTDRLIGFVSTLILARLLLPEDFGIIAMTSLVIGLVDVLLDLGVNVALIQNSDAKQEHYNAAWTLRLIQSAAATLLVVLASFFATAYFNDPRVAPVLQVTALGLLIAGFENIGIVTFQKEMRLDLDFRFTITKRIVTFCVTITGAWLLRSYWALVIGTLFGRCFGVLLSYYVHPMRARISFEKVREIMSVSQWMLVNSIGVYLNNNLHKLLIGRFASAQTMGSYTLADEISGMPSSELLSPLNRVLFPAFVQAKHNPLELKRIFLLAQGLQCLVAVPASLGLAVVARDAVMVLLGEKWLIIVPFLQVLALSHIIQAITSSSGYVLLTLRQISSATMTTWVQLVLFAIGSLFLLQAPTVIAFAWLRVAASCSGLFIALWMLMRNLNNVRPTEIFGTVIRPLLATAVMGLAIMSLDPLVSLPALPSLLLKIVVGILVYAAASIALWTLVGRPGGAEAYILEKAGHAFRARFRA